MMASRDITGCHKASICCKPPDITGLTIRDKFKCVVGDGSG
jgi:hypothetical protein